MQSPIHVLPFAVGVLVDTEGSLSMSSPLACVGTVHLSSPAHDRHEQAAADSTCKLSWEQMLFAVRCRLNV